MSNRKTYNKHILLISAFCIFLATALGCARLLRPEDKKEESGEQKKEPPKALLQIEEITNSLIQDMEKVREQRARQEREEKHPSKEEQKKDQAGDQGGLGGQGDTGAEQSGQKENEKGGQTQEQVQGGQAQQQGSKEQKPKESPIPQVNWNEFEKSVEELHAKWNAIEPQVRADGASRDSMDEFEERLNTFTEQVMARNEDNALTAANRLYGAIPGFLNLYKHKQPPEVKEIKYNVRQVMINGSEDKWEENEKLLEDIKKAWHTAKSRMARPDKNLNMRIDDAIEDFSLVAKQKKTNLVQIKGGILIQNLDKIE